MFPELSKVSLKDLAQYKANLDASLEGGAPEEVQELAEVAGLLLSGKVDQAARFKQALEAGIKAAEEQVQYLKQMLDETKRLMKEAVEASGSKRLDGVAYAIRVQNNSRSTVEILDEGKIPKSYFKTTFKVTFPWNDDERRFWAGALLKRVLDEESKMTKEESDLVDKCFSDEVSKSLVEEALKSGAVIEGVRYERGTHVRVDAGRVKPRIEKGSDSE